MPASLPPTYKHAHCSDGNPGNPAIVTLTLTVPLDYSPTHGQVDAPLAKVYRIWANRINYNEWFDLIGQVRAAQSRA